LDTVRDCCKQDYLAREVVVVDQSPFHDKETRDILSSWHENGQIRRVQLRKPAVNFARNLGAALSNGDLLLFLDDDVRIPSDLLSKHVDFHRTHLPNGLVGGVQDTKGNNPSRQQNPNPHFFCGCSGGHFSVKRDIFIALGGFDESFSGSCIYEDMDLGARWHTLGFPLTRDPNIVLTHLQEPTGGNRIGGAPGRPEWSYSVGYFHYGLRHIRPLSSLMLFLLKIFRRIALRRGNIKNPFLFLYGIASCFGGIVVATSRYRKGFRSSLVAPGVDQLRTRYGYANDAPPEYRASETGVSQPKEIRSGVMPAAQGKVV
jgi:GT2 family glycosyltransferase